MRIITDDGVGLEIAIDGTGPGLLLLHGLGGAKVDFEDHIDALASNHTVVTYDQRGHGASENPPNVDSYSFGRLIEDLSLVVDAVGFERFTLLGHSMGGMVARKFAIRFPHRIAALMMMDSSHGPIPGFDPALLQLAADTALEQGKDALKELLDAFAPLDTPAYQKVLAERPGYQELVDRKWADVSEVMWAVMIMELATQTDDLDAMRAISVPTLVIVGDQDQPFIGPSRTMVDAIADARYAEIPMAGHSPQTENADAWIAAVTGFLADTRGAAERAA